MSTFSVACNHRYLELGTELPIWGLMLRGDWFSLYNYYLPVDPVMRALWSVFLPCWNIIRHQYWTYVVYTWPYCWNFMTVAPCHIKNTVSQKRQLILIVGEDSFQLDWTICLLYLWIILFPQSLCNFYIYGLLTKAMTNDVIHLQSDSALIISVTYVY